LINTDKPAAVAMPPQKPWRSMSTTEDPNLAAARAAETPAGPPPKTKTSALGDSFLIRQLWGDTRSRQGVQRLAGGCVPRIEQPALALPSCPRLHFQPAREEVRRKLIEADLFECAIPPRLMPI
jgi:hypothetical protein